MTSDIKNEKWESTKITSQELEGWIRDSWAEAEEVEGPIKVFRSNDWGITALYKVHLKSGDKQEVVCKVGFLKIFETSVDIYQLLQETCQDSVPELIKGEYRDGKAWLQFKVFNGKPIKEENKLESLREVSRTMAKIQKKTTEYMKQHSTKVPTIEISSIPNLFHRLLDKYMEVWLENYRTIAAQLEMKVEDYTEIFNISTLGRLGEQLESLCKDLENISVSDTYSIDHVDLHSGNAAILEDGKFLIYDWEEAVISCPFFSMDKLLDEAEKLQHILQNEDSEKDQGIWNRSQLAVKESYLSELNNGKLMGNELSRAFDIAMCVAPVKYAYQGTFFLDQVGWKDMAPALVAESIIKAYKRCISI